VVFRDTDLSMKLGLGNHLDIPIERRKYINEEEFIVETLGRTDKKIV